MFDVPPHHKCAWFLPGTAYPVARQMAVESKPLFHPEVLRQQVRAFNLPEQTGVWQPKLQEWARLITSGRADAFKESELLALHPVGIAQPPPAGVSAVHPNIPLHLPPCRRRADTDVRDRRLHARLRKHSFAFQFGQWNAILRGIHVMNWTPEERATTTETPANASRWGCE